MAMILHYTHSILGEQILNHLKDLLNGFMVALNKLSRIALPNGWTAYH